MTFDLPDFLFFFPFFLKFSFSHLPQYGLFFGALRGQATSEQLSKLLEEGALTLKGMYGCFAMTELGHGSNVPGLETTATFDAAADEFVINTPTLTATKWWIGGAAHSATHTYFFKKKFFFFASFQCPKS